MADKKQQRAAATKRRIERLTQELARVERQIAFLQYQAKQVARLDLIVARPGGLFAKHRSSHMH